MIQFCFSLVFWPLVVFQCIFRGFGIGVGEGGQAIQVLKAREDEATVKVSGSKSKSVDDVVTPVK